MPTKKQINKNVTIPRFLYDSLCESRDLIKHLAHYSGYGWIEAVKKEMETDKKYKLGAFKEG